MDIILVVGDILHIFSPPPNLVDFTYSTVDCRNLSRKNVVVCLKLLERKPCPLDRTLP